MGKRQGVQDTMGIVAMALVDKFGWHQHEETEDVHDTKSVQYLYDCLVDLIKEVNAGRIKHKDIRKVLEEECNIVFE